MAIRDVTPPVPVKATGAKGHKPNCQCGICRRMRGESRKPKLSQVVQAPASQVPVSTIVLGGKFIHNNQLYQKVAVVDGMSRGIGLVEREGGLYLDSSIRVGLTQDCLVEEGR